LRIKRRTKNSAEAKFSYVPSRHARKFFILAGEYFPLISLQEVISPACAVNPALREHGFDAAKSSQARKGDPPGEYWHGRAVQKSKKPPA